jgi:hypothetical protein
VAEAIFSFGKDVNSVEVKTLPSQESPNTNVDEESSEACEGDESIPKQMCHGIPFERFRVNNANSGDAHEVVGSVTRDFSGS